MTEPSSGSDRMAQMNSIYQALGRFIVEFSRVVSAMETGLYFVTGGDQQLTRTIVIELTADPVARAWRSSMIQAIDLSDDDLKVLTGLAGEISALINLRNDWAHGAWFIGYGDETTTDWSQAALMRFKNTAKGMALPSKLERLPTAAYIEKAATHAALLADAISTFGMIVVMRQLGETKDTRPSDRVRIKEVDGHRQVQVTQDGSNWRSSNWA
jgi:hypothetical protein